MQEQTQKQVYFSPEAKKVFGAFALALAVVVLFGLYALYRHNAHEAKRHQSTSMVISTLDVPSQRLGTSFFI